MYRPPLYDNESFYGYMGRISRHVMLPISIIKDQFFGAHDFRISLLLPTRPGKIVDRGIFSREEVEDIIQHHTLLEYFKSCLTVERFNVLGTVLWKNDNKMWVFESKYGFDGHSPHHRVPKYCPICLDEQIEKFGEPYLNRLHQIPKILVCVEHNCNLEDCILELGGANRYPFYRASIHTCPRIVPSFNDSAVVLEIARLCVAISKGDYKIDFDYQTRTRQLGYFKGSRVDQVKLKYEFEKFYNGYSANYDPYSYLLFEKMKVGDPYRHIMLDYFLNAKREELPLPRLIIPIKKKYWDKIYFGNEPWNCLKPSCKRNVIVKFKYSREGKKTIGYFSCDCGVRYRRSYIIEDGNVIKVITKNLHKENKISKHRHNSKPFLRRRNWIRLKLKASKSSEEKKLISSLRHWLKQYDEKWFIKNEPIVNLKSEKANEKIKKATIAKELAQLDNIIIKLRQWSIFRITRKCILKAARMNINKKHNSVIENLIKKASESLEEFHIRKVGLKLQQMKKEGSRISLFTLLRATTRKPTKKVKDEAERIFNSLNY